MKELVELVQQWSIDKGLDIADYRGQFLKIVEEVGEVAAALCRSDMDALKDGIGDVVVTLIIYAQQKNITPDFDGCKKSNGNVVSHDSVILSDILDDVCCLTIESNNLLRLIEDIVVNLNTFCKSYNEFDLEECLQAAYDEISGRTGKMVNGIFVKQEDLPQREYNQSDWDNKNGSIAGYGVDSEKQGDLL